MHFWRWSIARVDLVPLADKVLFCLLVMVVGSLLAAFWLWHQVLFIVSWVGHTMLGLLI